MSNSKAMDSAHASRSPLIAQKPFALIQNRVSK